MSFNYNARSSDLADFEPDVFEDDGTIISFTTEMIHIIPQQPPPLPTLGALVRA